jgi:hypothetical protein
MGTAPKYQPVVSYLALLSHDSTHPAVYSCFMKKKSPFTQTKGMRSIINAYARTTS